MRSWAIASVLAVSLALAGCGQQPQGGGEAATGEGAASAEGVAAAAEHPGKQTYDRFCTSCHTMGAAGAPKTGDKAAWAPRIAQGMDTLVQATIAGKPPGMPAKGLCISCSDAELRAAVEYMVSKSQ
jgi:cytochrome c5